MNNYQETKDALLGVLSDAGLMFKDVDEAIDYIGVEEREVADRLVADSDVQRTYRRRIIEERATLRASMLKEGRAGNDKMAKAALSLVSDDMEWARLNGKSFKQLTVGDPMQTQQIQIVAPDVSKLPTAQLQAILAARTAEEGKEVEE